MITENEPITCERLRRLGYPEGYYSVDVDGVAGPVKPFPAYCSKAYTVLRPVFDTTVSEPVTVTCDNDCTTPQSKTLQYYVDDTVFQATRRTSTQCTQSVQMMNCVNIGPVDAQGNVMTYWKSADNLEMPYWPEGPPSGGCKCALDDTCTSGKPIALKV